MWYRALPADPKPAKKKKSSFGVQECVYRYHDATGEPAFEVVRFKNQKGSAKGDPMEFGGIAGIELVPYRLPELLAAPAADLVFVAEGEKAVEALRKLGLIATCNPMGAGKWRS